MSATHEEPDVDRTAPPPDPAARIAVERHRRGNRWMHWINFPILTVMIWSGLRIYWADLRDPFGVGIAGWHWFDLFPDGFNEELSLNRKLARGMAFHFTFGWLFVINGLAFAAYLSRTKGWRNFMPTRDDLRQIPAVLLHEVGLRKDAPPQGKYNGVQQLSYAGVLVMGALAIISGFAIYKPTQLSLLTTMLGGYSSARFIHFAVTIGFMMFFVIHIVQVLRSGLSNVFSMITGYELLPTGDLPRNATVERRVNARIRDTLGAVLWSVALVGLWTVIIDSDQNPDWNHWIVILAVAGGFLNDALRVGLTGTTPGKKAWGLTVVKAGTDQAPGIARAVIRSLWWLPMLLAVSGNRGGVIVALVVAGALALGSLVLMRTHPTRRSPLDLLAGTEVIADPLHTPVPGTDVGNPEDADAENEEVAR